MEEMIAPLLFFVSFVFFVAGGIVVT